MDEDSVNWRRYVGGLSKTLVRGGYVDRERDVIDTLLLRTT